MAFKKVWKLEAEKFTMEREPAGYVPSFRIHMNGHLIAASMAVEAAERGDRLAASVHGRSARHHWDWLRSFGYYR